MIQATQSKITGVGAYLPKLVVSSEDLMRDARCERFGIRPNFLFRASGIESRRIATSETVTEMALLAARQALTDSGIDAVDIQMVMFCGIENDYPEPSTAHEIQRALQCDNAVCFDVSNACLGLLSGLSIADAYISSGAIDNVLICTGERPSKVTYDVLRQINVATGKKEFHRLLGALTVGDAGGAFVVCRSEDQTGCRYMRFETYTEHRNLCYYQQKQSHIEFVMDMETISNAMTDAHEKLIEDTYTTLGWAPDIINKVYCHQVGAKPHKKMAHITKVPLQKVPVTYNLYGNLTSATFAVNLMLNPPQKGERVLFLGAGSGLSICQIGIQF